MKLLMLFADQFEDVEAIGTLDVLQRGGDEVICASMMDTKQVQTKCGNTLSVPYLIDEVELDKMDGIIIPGGPASFKRLAFMPKVDELIRYFVQEEKLVSAICAAPFLIGRLGYLSDKNYTVHPGFETEVKGGTYLREQGVVRDGRFITAKSMFYSLEFGYKIHAYFHGDESVNKLRLSCQGEK